MGEDDPNMENIKKLSYTMAVIKETLRLFPPAHTLLKTYLKDTTLGPWDIKEGARVVVLIKEVHRNKEYWGDNVDDFDPSRFLPNSPNSQKHEYAWLPFSSGPRGCIGMQFSLIEARIILLRMVQRFTSRLHKDAEVKEKFRTFMKLSKVFVTAHDIKRSDKLSSHYPIAEPKTTTTTPTIADMDLELIENYDGKLSIYYGSSMGTCEDLAQRVCDETKQLGFDASVRPLDFAASEGFEKDSLVIIVTSTYNGYPPDNAKKFAEYCKNLEPNSLQGVKVAIIGIGNSIWKSFQAFPPFIEFALRSAGAEILCERGVADEEKDMQGDIDSRVDSEFWPSVFEAVGLKPYTSAKRASIDRYYSDVLKLVVTDSTRQSHHPLRSAGNKLATVVSARELHSPSSDRSARHVEFKLPIGMDYHEGDHLAIFPENDSELVLRVASLLKEHDLGRVAMMTAASNDDTAFRHLPLGIPIKVSDLLGRYVDLQAPITTSFVNVAVLSAADFEQAEALKGIAELICDGVIGDWQQLRPLQILTAFPSVQMTLENALATIAPMKKRYYSISSSSVDSKIEPQIDSVTVGLIEGASVRNHTILAAAQLDSKKFRGVSSGYLADIRPGQLVEVSVVKNDRFRLPNDTSIPIIMIGAGTGLAPFRGFIQAMNAEVRGRRQAMLFFGCRNENYYIYRSELESAPCNTKF